MWLGGQLLQRLHKVIRRRELERRLVVGLGHSRWKVHLYAVVDVLLLDQSTGGCKHSGYMTETLSYRSNCPLGGATSIVCLVFLSNHISASL